MSDRAGIGYDSHRFEAGRRFVLGGVEVPEAERGLAGHSGQHFPDTDERWRDADSIVLLGEVCRFLGEHEWRILHLDATVICETPKLGHLRDEIRRSLAGAIGLQPLEVNVKFTTNEGMGFVGRGEGVAAMAVASVERAD